MSQSQADHFKAVFGEEGKRNSSQQAVWATVIDRILRDSRTEAKLQESARDYALFIHNQVNKNTNGIDNDAGPKYRSHR